MLARPNYSIIFDEVNKAKNRTLKHFKAVSKSILKIDETFIAIFDASTHKIYIFNL